MRQLQLYCACGGSWTGYCPTEYVDRVTNQYRGSHKSDHCMPINPQAAALIYAGYANSFFTLQPPPNPGTGQKES